jgi:hypothetical protein
MKVKVYRFETYNPEKDSMSKSNRWATREAIDWVRGHALEGTEREIESSLLGREVSGMTDRGYRDPDMGEGMRGMR